MFARNLRAESNVQNIPGIFQNLLNKSLVAHAQNIHWDIPLYAAVCYVFVPFFMEYSWNILPVRPCPKVPGKHARIFQEYSILNGIKSQ